MKISSRECTFLVSICAFSLLSGCGSKEPEQTMGIANPASEHCIKQGGKREIIKDESGEKGMCHLPDGTVVEEWELFRSDTYQN